MITYKSVDAPFTGDVVGFADEGLLSVGLYYWMADLLKKELQKEYEEVDVIVTIGHSYTHKIPLMFFLGIEDIRWEESESSAYEIEDHAANKAEELLRSAVLTDYLLYFQNNHLNIQTKFKKLMNSYITRATEATKL